MGTHNQGAILHNSSFADLGPKHNFSGIKESVRPPSVMARPSIPTPTPVAGDAVHNAYCNVCSRTIVGIRQKCLDCPDYDMCNECHTTKREKHDAQHQFYGLTEPGRVVVHEVDRIEPTHPVERLFPPPGPRMRRRGPTPPEGEAPEEFRGPPWARRHNGPPGAEGGHPWARPRHHGPPGPHPFHHGHPGRHPGRPHHGPFSGFIPPPPPVAQHPFFRLPGAFPGPAPPAPGGVEVPIPGSLNTPVPSPVVRAAHNANCDMCDSKIIGIRHKCTACPDYDVCESCFTIVAEQHPRHAFVKVRDPADLMVRPFHLSGKTVHHARCDGESMIVNRRKSIADVYGSLACGHQINGARFKCLHPSCPDFDLCENCEALPIDAHPSAHALVKLRQPVGDYEGLQRVLDFAYRRPTSEETRQNIITEQAKERESLNKAMEEMAAEMERMAKAQSVHEPQIIRVGGLPSPRASSPAPRIVLGPGIIRIASPPSPRASSPAPRIVPLTAPTRGFSLGYEPFSPSRPEWTPVAPAFVPTAYTQAGYSVTSPFAVVVPPPASILDEKDDDPFSMEPITPSRPERVATPQPETPVIVQSSPFTDEHAEATATAPTTQTRSVSPTASQTSQTSQVTESIRPSASFVDDNNVPDGQVMAPGTLFVKSWKLKNDGTVAWPAKSQLLFSGGDRMGTSPSAELLAGGGTEPGAFADVSIELRAPSAPGRYSSFWRLKDEEGRPFGHRVWCDITVVEESHSDSSLASSVVIMPTVIPVPAPVEVPAPAEAMSDFEGTVSTGSNVGDDEYLSDNWEVASRAESPDQFIMVYESSNASDSDD